MIFCTQIQNSCRVSFPHSSGQAMSNSDRLKKKHKQYFSHNIVEYLGIIRCFWTEAFSQLLTGYTLLCVEIKYKD